MVQRVNVEWYIANKMDRITIACQHEAVQHKLDNDRFRQLVIQEMRAQADDYTDDYGTQGFVRWMAKIILMVRRGYDHINQRAITSHLPLTEPINGSEITSAHGASNGLKLEHTIVDEMELLKPDDNYGVKQVCKKCNVEKPEGDFYYNDGRGVRDTTCKKCRGDAAKAKKNGTKQQPMVQVKEVKLDVVGFNNEELDFLIGQAKAEQEKIDEQIMALNNKRSMYDGLVLKLEKRKK